MWPLFSSRTAWSLTSALESDHCIAGDPHLPLSARVRAVVQAEMGSCPRGPVRMLTGLRILGMEFNPVSFFFLFDETDTELMYVVAEVNNIPWFEQHTYALAPLEQEGIAPVARGELRRFSGHPKAFHVSPFIDMSHISYSWLLTDPCEKLRMKIGLERASVPFFIASLDATRSSFSAWNIVKHQFYYPLQTAKVVGAIMWEALKLFRKGFVFVPHPSETETAASTAIASIVKTVTSIRQTWRSLIERSYQLKARRR